MRKTIAAIALAIGAVALAPTAHAGSDDVLCSSNIAYRNAPAHKLDCAPVGINSHGHGGGQFADKDGDGIPNGEDTQN